MRTKRRRKLVRPRMPLEVPNAPDERWSVDFMSDQLADGRRFRILNIVDDFNRECVGQVIDSSISGTRMARYLDTPGRRPTRLVCDNGQEFTSKAMLFWARENEVKLHFIQPGKPTQNHYNEERPHSSLGFKPPRLFAERAA